MITLEISEGYRSLVDPPSLRDAVKIALEHQSAPANAELTLVITDDAQIRALNATYLGVDAPTDVLSFPADFIDPESDAPYLGDVLISYPQAAAQAQSAGHTPQAELQLLTVHGLLHLLGHDHATPSEKTAMWAAQTAILRELGLENITPTEAEH